MQGLVHNVKHRPC